MLTACEKLLKLAEKIPPELDTIKNQIMDHAEIVQYDLDYNGEPTWFHEELLGFIETSIRKAIAIDLNTIQ